MLRLLIPVILLLLGLGGGVGAGLMMAGGGDEASAYNDEDDHGDDGYGSSDDDHGSDDGYGDDSHAEEEDSYGSDDGHGGGDYGSESDSEYEYVRLNNQFIVPILRHGTVRSLVVMSLTIEVPNGQNTLVYGVEPRLRDSFLRVMFAHANVGGFDGNFTTAEAMEPLREGLLEAATAIIGDAAHDVLIVDIVRQDA